MYVPGGMMYVLKDMKTEVSLSLHSLGYFQHYFWGQFFSVVWTLLIMLSWLNSKSQ